MLETIEMNNSNFKLEMTKFFMNLEFSNGPISLWDMNEFNLLIIKVIQKIEDFNSNVKLTNYRLIENIMSLWFEIDEKVLNLEMKFNNNKTSLIKWK